MTRRYTAADFANARFAEHEDGRIAARLYPDEIAAWADDTNGYTDAGLSQQGWVPVPTKPTITQSSLREKIKAHGDSWANGFYAALNELGGEIIPDPEPTNTDRLEQLLASYDGYGMESTFEKLATHLNDHGVTAPKEDK